MKTTEQYFPVVLFIMPYKVVLTFEPVDKILKCDRSNESYRAVLACGAVYYAVQVKAIEQYFLMVLYIMLYIVLIAFQVCG